MARAGDAASGGETSERVKRTRAQACLTNAQVEDLSLRVWDLAAAHAATFPPLDLLSRLLDKPAPADGAPAGLADRLAEGSAESLEEVANLRFVTDDAVQALVGGMRRFLRVLAQTTEAEVVEGRMPPGYVDWPATLRARAISGGDLSTTVLTRTEVHRDLPETRLLRFLLTDIHRRANDALATHDFGDRRQAIEAVALETGRLATHPLLRPVPAAASRQGYLHARASRLVGYRAVARAYEVYQALFGRGDRDTVVELFRSCVSAPRLGERAFAALVLCRLVAWLEARGARRVTVHLHEPGHGLSCWFVTAAGQIDVHFQHVPPHLFDGDGERATTPAPAAVQPGLPRPDVVIHASGGGQNGSDSRTALLGAHCSLASEAARPQLAQLQHDLDALRRSAGPNARLVLVTGSPAAGGAAWKRLEASLPGQVTHLDFLEDWLESLELH